MKNCYFQYSDLMDKLENGVLVDQQAIGQKVAAQIMLLIQNKASDFYASSGQEIKLINDILLEIQMEYDVKERYHTI